MVILGEFCGIRIRAMRQTWTNVLLAYQSEMRTELGQICLDDISNRVIIDCSWLDIELRFTLNFIIRPIINQLW